MRVYSKTLTPVLLLSILALCSSALSRAQAGRPKPPPATPIYTLHLFSMPPDYAGGGVSVAEINDMGEAVGRYRHSDGTTQQPFIVNAFSADPVVTNLNDIPLDPAWDVPAGWRIYTAYGINNLGDIVGSLALISDLSRRRGFILEQRPDPRGSTLLPRLHLVPDDVSNDTYAYTWRINDAGEVLGSLNQETGYIYRPGLHGVLGENEISLLPFVLDVGLSEMNNPTANHGTQILAWSRTEGGFIRYTVHSPMEVAALELLNLPSSVGDIRSLSDSGNFCGHQYIKRTYHPYYFDGAMQTLSGAEFGQAINLDNDVLGEGGTSGNKPVLYHATRGVLPLAQIVIASNASEQAIWTNGSANWSTMTERNIAGTNTDLPAIAGSLSDGTFAVDTSYFAYVLLPIPPQQ